MESRGRRPAIQPYFLMTIRKPVALLFNGYSGVTSGGDEHAVRLALFLADDPALAVHVIIPKNSYETLRRHPSIIAHDVMDTKWAPKGRLFLFGLSLVYIIRILQAIRILFALPRYTVHVATSHLVHDVIPTLIFPTRRTVCYAHHLLQTQLRSSFFSRLNAWAERVCLPPLLRRRSLFFTGSPATRNQLLRAITRDDVNADVVLTSNGIDVPKVGAVIPVSERKTALCCVGRLTKQKGVLDLMPLLNALSKTQPTIRLCVIGGGDLEQVLIRGFCTEVAAGRVELCGKIGDEEKFSRLADAAVLVVPSREEGWGIVIAEALASGCRVVAYDLPELVELWAKNVTFATRFDCDDLARAVAQSLAAGDLSDSEHATRESVLRDLKWESILSREHGLISNFMLQSKPNVTVDSQGNT